MLVALAGPKPLSWRYWTSWPPPWPSSLVPELSSQCIVHLQLVKCIADVAHTRKAVRQSIKQGGGTNAGSTSTVLSNISLAQAFIIYIEFELNTTWNLPLAFTFFTSIAAENVNQHINRRLLMNQYRRGKKIDILVHMLGESVMFDPSSFSSSGIDLPQREFLILLEEISKRPDLQGKFAVPDDCCMKIRLAEIVMPASDILFRK